MQPGRARQRTQRRQPRAGLLGCDRRPERVGRAQRAVRAGAVPERVDDAARQVVEVVVHAARRAGYAKYPARYTNGMFSPWRER